MIIDALKGKYALPILPAYFHMAKSSYYYQQAVRNKPDKYFPLREQIVSVFHDNRGLVLMGLFWTAMDFMGIVRLFGVTFMAANLSLT